MTLCGCVCLECGLCEDHCECRHWTPYGKRAECLVCYDRRQARPSGQEGKP